MRFLPVRAAKFGIELIIGAVFCGAIATRLEAGEAGPELHKSSANASKLKAFNPPRKELVQASIWWLYAIFGVRALGFAVLIFAWAKYYVPKSWNRSSTQPTNLSRRQIASTARAKEVQAKPEEKDRYELEGDIVDFMREMK